MQGSAHPNKPPSFTSLPPASPPIQLFLLLPLPASCKSHQSVCPDLAWRLFRILRIRRNWERERERGREQERAGVTLPERRSRIRREKGQTPWSGWRKQQWELRCQTKEINQSSLSGALLYWLRIEGLLDKKVKFCFFCVWRVLLHYRLSLHVKAWM